MGGLALAHGSGRIVALANSAAGIIIFNLGTLAVALLPVGRWRVGRPVRVAGAALFAGGWLLAWASLRRLGRNYSRRVVLKPEQRLVTEGPYARIRHPMYTASVLVYLGMCLALGSALGLITLALVVIPRFVLVARHEDRLLAEEFGEEHEDWTRRVGRFWPLLGLL